MEFTVAVVDGKIQVVYKQSATRFNDDEYKKKKRLPKSVAPYKFEWVSSGFNLFFIA